MADRDVGSGSVSSARVLVVEDDDLVAGICLDALGSIGRTTRAATGPEAVDVLDHEHFDVIVMDVVLPPPDGLTILRGLREHRRPELVLLVSGALSTPADRAAGLAMGADDYLAKPFDLDELRERVGALLRRSPGGAVAGLLGDLVVDPARRRARRGSVEIDLTPREFQLLERLTRHPRQVLSRAELLQDVWGTATAISSSVLDVYISRLRRKIDEPFGRTCIETVRGRGFRYVPEA